MFSRRSARPNETEKSPLVAVTVAAVWGLMLVLFAVVSWQARFVMDEFNLFQGLRSFSKHTLYQTLDPIKTVFGTELFRIANLASGSVGIMRAGRMLGLCAALATMAAIFLISRELWPHARHRLLVLVSALSYSNLFEGAFSIRTDTVALTFAAGSLLFLVRSRRRRSHLAVSGALMGLSFLCTQKAVYLLAACFIALVVATWLDSGWRRALQDSLLFASGWLAVFVGYAIYFGGAHGWRVITMVFLGPRFVLEGTAAFSGLGMFIYQTLTRNLIPYAISLAGLGIALARWKSAGFSVRVALIATVIVTLLIFHHDQPWPYVFVWPQMLLSLWVIPLADWVAERRWLARDQAVLALTFLAALSLPRQVRYLNHTNAEQISVMVQAENLLEPGSTYFDGIGMIVDRDIAGDYPGWWWDTPTIARIRAALKSGNASDLQSVMDAHPKLWILNYRILIMSDVVQRMVAGGYVRISPNLLLSGVELDPGAPETPFACHWAGRYRLFNRHGGAVAGPVGLDGLAPAEVVSISPGLHRVRGPQSKEPLFLLPADTPVRNPLAPQGPVPDLYADVYTY
jgi:hypothetical protein